MASPRPTYTSRTGVGSSRTTCMRSRSPLTTSTGSVRSAAHSVPITSSASWPSAPAVASPAAASTSRITGTCGSSPPGTTSGTPTGAVSGPPATRCALYVGSAFTRNAGRQSRSRHATSRPGRRSVSSRETMSQNPRTALTGVPSGAVIDSGTP